MQDETVQPRIDPGLTANMTSWAKEPVLQDLKNDLQVAKQSHDAQMTKIAAWQALMNVTGKEKPAARKGRSQVQPKLVRRQAEWRYSALTEPFVSSDKLFKISPVSAEDTKSARQNEIMINYQFRTKINKIKFVDDLVRSDVDEGTAIVRTGWVRTTVEVEEDAPVFSFYTVETQEELQALQQAVELSKADPRTFNEQATPEMKEAVAHYEETGQAVTAQVTSTQKVKVEKVLENRPDLKVFNPKNVMIDPTCDGDLEKATFCIFLIETSKAELLKDKGRYKNLDKINWESAAPATNPDIDSKSPNGLVVNDILRRKIVAYEYWGFHDIRGTGELVPIVCTWIGDTIIRMEENPFPDGKLPLVVIPYLPIKRELYGEPDAELLADNQRILGAVTRGMIDLLGRSANSQQGFAKGMLDPVNRKRFENGDDYEFNPNLSTANGHITHKYPEFPQSAMMMLGMQNQEAEALTGVKSFAGGMSGDAYGDVAAGIRGVLDAASKREMAILRRLAYGMAEIARKIVMMNAVFLSDEEVVRVTNEEFVTIRREDLKGEFDYKVDISTAEVEDQQAKDLAFMLQTMGPNMDFAMTQMILAEIARLKKMPELADRIMRFKPEPDPLQQQIQQLEIAKLQAEIEQIKAKTQEHLANAAKKASEKDKADLDFVEQESGVTHARNLQQTQAQGRANQDLQVTKALTTPRKVEEKDPDIEAAVGFNALTDVRDQEITLGGA